MTELVLIEVHCAFDEACLRAQHLAVELKHEITVIRSHSLWHVRGSAFARALVATAEPDTRLSGVDAVELALEEQYRREVLVPLHEDMRDEQDAWALSEEEGWFYDDEA